MPDGSKSVRVTRYDQLGRVIFVSEWMSESGYSAATKTTWNGPDIDGDLSPDYTVTGVPMQGSVPDRPWGTLYFYGAPATGDEQNPLAAIPDGLGRLTRVERADGSATATDYCGMHQEVSVSDVQTSITGPNLQDAVTRLYYDGMGRLVLVDAPDASADAVYTYDMHGNLTHVRLVDQLPASLPLDAWRNGTITGGQERSFVYDAAGRLIQATDPESGTRFHDGYDAAGNLLVWRDQLAAVREYFFKNTFDGLGRVATVERVHGTLTSPATTDVSFVGDRGDFEEAADISPSDGPGVWVEGLIDSTGVFVPSDTAGQSAWQQTSYGTCLPAPPDGSNYGGLYFGSSCSYATVVNPTQTHAVRYKLDDLTRNDFVSLKFWRHVREGEGDLDAFTVFVTPQSDGNDTSEARYLLDLDQSQSSYATWRQTDAMRIGDLFTATEWPEETGGSLATEDVYLYIAFNKGDAEQSGLGTGVLVDDVFVGHRAVETIAEYTYDADACSSGAGDAACSFGPEANNRYLGKLAQLSSYQGGRLASDERYVYRGMNGRLSSRQIEIDWAGVGAPSQFVDRYGYSSAGQLDEFQAPFQPGLEEFRQYDMPYVKGFLDGIHSDGWPFVEAGADPPSIVYSAAGQPDVLRFANGTWQQFGRDMMYRPQWAHVGSSSGTLWDSGAYAYDGAGNITQIGDPPNAQQFAYDLAGRLTEARVLPQATDPAETVPYAVAYDYDTLGNMTQRTWSHDLDSAPPGAVVNQSFNSGNQISTTGFAYDANGNMTRGVFADVPMAAVWDPQGRMAAIYNGQPEDGAHQVAERYLYDVGRLRLVRYPDKQDGRPVISVRSGSGDVLSEFVVDPSTGEARLDKDFVYGAGQLLVERKVTDSPPVFQANNVLYGGGNYFFALIDRRGADTFTMDIRTDSGYVNQITGLTGPGNKFIIPENEFAVDEVNYIRIRAESDEATTYSVPVTLMIDSSVTSQSTNQVRAVSVSRVGTDVLVSFDTLEENGQKTYLYFEREDTGQRVPQTPLGIAAGVTYTTITDQSFPVPCGRMLPAQVGVYNAGPDVPAWHVAQTVGSEGAQCDPAPSPSSWSFAEYYHHRDHLGSLRVVTGEQGAAVAGHDYYPYGWEVGLASAVAEDSTHRYTGHERDDASGIDYMMTRYKHPFGGEFLSSDSVYDVTVGLPASWNMYGYVRGNPVRFSDPTGAFIDVRLTGFVVRMMFGPVYYSQGSADRPKPLPYLPPPASHYGGPGPSGIGRPLSLGQPSRGPSSPVAEFYDLYSVALHECMKEVFGRMIDRENGGYMQVDHYRHLGRQSAANAPRLNTSLSGQQLVNKFPRSLHGADPNRIFGGFAYRSETIFIVSAVAAGPANQFHATYAHELGNALAWTLNSYNGVPSRYYSTIYGIQPSHGRDPDAGHALEQCMKKKGCF